MILHVGYGLAYTLAGLWILIWPGNWLCQYLLKRTGLTAAKAAHEAAVTQPGTATTPAFEAGRVIGGLER